MKKPSKTLIALNKIGVITCISIDYRQTGNESAESVCVLTGKKWNGEQMLSTHYKGLLSSVEEYLDLDPDYRSVARLKESCQKTITEWEQYERNNASELAEYKRLKLKFEGLL